MRWQYFKGNVICLTEGQHALLLARFDLSRERDGKIKARCLCRDFGVGCEGCPFELIQPDQCTTVLRYYGGRRFTKYVVLDRNCLHWYSRHDRAARSAIKKVYEVLKGMYYSRKGERRSK